jgi:uncharacterized membrane protein (DUF4010 family)
MSKMIFPPYEVAIKIAIALGVGLLVGFERAWAHKEVGVRTFSITALLGMLSALVSNQFAIVSLVGVFVLIVYINGRSLLVDRSVEMTTSVALIVTFVLGVLVGQGHLFTPVASAILMTMLLAWKMELQRFAGDLSPSEVRGAVLLGLIGFVIYPILPNRFVDNGHLLNPRQSWAIVIIIAGLGFLNYVLLRLFANRGLYYTAGLGGLVNSTATVAELSRLLTGKASGMAVALVLIASVAMFLRNLLILAIFAPAAVPIAASPILAMTLIAVLFAWKKRQRDAEPVGPLHVSSPVSLKHVLKFGAIFVVMQIVGTIGARYLGKYGFLALSLVGGMVSSASTTATAATMAIHGKLSPDVAGVATIFASITSALVNLPLVERQTHDRRVTRTLAVISAFLVAIGLVVLVLRQKYGR